MASIQPRTSPQKNYIVIFAHPQIFKCKYHIQGPLLASQRYLLRQLPHAMLKTNDARGGGSRDARPRRKLIFCAFQLVCSQQSSREEVSNRCPAPKLRQEREERGASRARAVTFFSHRLTFFFFLFSFFFLF